MHRYSPIGEVSKILNISTDDYIYFTKYVLENNFTDMLTFKCKSTNCFVYIRHNDTDIGKLKIFSILFESIIKNPA